MRRVKYKERKDGKGKETTKAYDGVRKHFYGKTDEEIDAKIDAYEKSREKPAARKFEALADAWWGEKYDTIGAGSAVYSHSLIQITQLQICVWLVPSRMLISSPTVKVLLI